MIIKESYMINDIPFVRTYSDAGRYVVRDGVSYDEAHDPAEFGRTYTEGELIPEEEIEPQEALNILLGDDDNG